jgi:hypothetical protein
MTHFIETTTKDGKKLRIEVEDTSKPSAGFTRDKPTDVSNEAVADAYTQVLDAISGVAAGLLDTVQNLETAPTTAAVDFAVKIDGEVGAMVAKSRDDAQFRVSLTWKQASDNEDE